MKLTPSMLIELAKMAEKLEWQGMCHASNENVARALEKRGAVKIVESRGRWNYYRITPAGRSALSKEPGE